MQNLLLSKYQAAQRNKFDIVFSYSNILYRSVIWNWIGVPTHTFIFILSYILSNKTAIGKLLLSNLARVIAADSTLQIFIDI